MRIVLVGQRDGKCCVRWGATALAACLAGTIGALGAIGAYYILSWSLSPLALIFGFAGGCIVIGTGVMRALKLPAEQLPLLKG